MVQPEKGKEGIRLDFRLSFCSATKERERKGERGGRSARGLLHLSPSIRRAEPLMPVSPQKEKGGKRKKKRGKGADA